MALLKDKDRQTLAEAFKAITIPVKLVVFTQENECDYCADTRQIVQEVAELSELVEVDILDLVADGEVAGSYGVDKIPAISVTRGGDQPKDYRIRYFGIPSGYEFSSLIEDIIMVGTGDSGLSEATKAIAAKLTQPLHLQVFVTPTCPYCPGAVRLAHQLAMESDMVTGDMVEAIEFPHLSMKYSVQGVPRTVANETVHIEGRVPEAMLMDRLRGLLN